MHPRTKVRVFQASLHDWTISFNERLLRLEDTDISPAASPSEELSNEEERGM